jgi:hypothetical protein
MRLPVTVSINDRTIDAILDTGSVTTIFPDSYLRGLGYQPVDGPVYGETNGGTQATYYFYKVPFPAIVQDGRTVALGTGQTMVLGEMGGPIAGQQTALIGCDMLSRDNLTLRNGIWTLTIPSS